MSTASRSTHSLNDEHEPSQATFGTSSALGHDYDHLAAAMRTPLPDETNSLLEPPQPRFSHAPFVGTDSPRDSVASPTSANNSNLALAGAGAGLLGGADVAALGSHSDHEVYNEKAPPAGARAKRRRRLLLLVGAAVFLIVALAVALPVGLIVGKKGSKNNNLSSGNGGGGGSGDPNPNGSNNPPTNKNPTTGGDGSTVTMEDGTTFTYSNKFGGFWVDDPADPFNNGAQPNSWTPPLNTSWVWGQNKANGVNLGGWFVLEPFIAPALFQKYQGGATPVVDEWTLSQAMAADTSAGGGLGQLEDHYNTFITEEDFAQIAGAGLNWVRMPIPFWAIDKWDDEPFLARTSWKYILRAFRWARKYGLRVNLDLHTIPGSQNGYNHSGKDGQINFLMGVMGYANAQRALGYIRIIAEFISQPEYKDVVPMFGIINEPRAQEIGKDELSAFYLQAYDLIRSITGTGAGNGAYIGIHDGFLGLSAWADFFPGADRMILDTHPYFAFNGQTNTDPIGAWPAKACNTFGPGMGTSQTAFGITVAGEMSNGINDCGLYLNGVPGTGHSYGGDCSFWFDSTQWNDTIKSGLNEFALASMDSLQNWFFWTWKIGNSTSGTVESPLWSYQLGLQGGWMPTDPRSANGACSSIGVDAGIFSGTYSAWQTGAPGASTLDPAVVASFSAWPPPAMNGVDGPIALLPTYTATGAVSTLPPDTFTAAPKTVSVGNGWADAADTALGVTEVAGCTYPNAWDSDGVVMPTAACTGAVTPARAAKRMLITPPPKL